MTDAWTEPETDVTALRYELDGCREVITELRAALGLLRADRDAWRDVAESRSRLADETAQRLDVARARAIRYRRALGRIIRLYNRRPEQRAGGAVAIAAEALGLEDQP